MIYEYDKRTYSYNMGLTEKENEKRLNKNIKLLLFLLVKFIIETIKENDESILLEYELEYNKNIHIKIDQYLLYKKFNSDELYNLMRDIQMFSSIKSYIFDKLKNKLSFLLLTKKKDIKIIFDNNSVCVEIKMSRILYNILRLYEANKKRFFLIALLIINFNIIFLTIYRLIRSVNE